MYLLHVISIYWQNVGKIGDDVNRIVMLRNAGSTEFTEACAEVINKAVSDSVRPIRPTQN